MTKKQDGNKEDDNREDDNREDDNVHQIITEQKMKNEMLVRVKVFKVQALAILKPTSCGHEFQLFFQCFGFRSIEILRNVSTWHNIFCDVLGLLRSSIGTVREHLRAI